MGVVSKTIDTFPTTVMPSYDYMTSHEQKNIVTPMRSGVTEANNIWRFPKRKFALAYRVLSDTDRDTLVSFIRNQRNSWKEFWYIDFKQRNWYDEYVGYWGPHDVDGALAADGTVFTDETDEATDATHDDMTLLPAAPALNDAYYFGHKNKFDKLTITIHDAGAPAYVNGVSGWTVDWEYWDGNSWESVAGLNDATVAFTAAAGDHDVTFTMPSDWAIYEVEDRYLYWIRARVDDFETCTTPPTGTQAWVNSQYFDLPSYGTTMAGIVIYQDGVTATEGAGAGQWAHISGGGAGGSDRIYFNGYGTTGVLITADFEGYLRIKARLGIDVVDEEVVAPSYYSVSMTIQESNLQ